MSEKMVEISVESVSKSYQTDKGGELVSLQNVSMDIYRNEFLCIMGPSGCGKTTLLNIVAGFLSRDSGSVKIRDKVVEKPGPDRVVVFQADAVFPWMTVEENIGYNPRIMGKSQSEQKTITDRFIRFVHLDEFRHAWPKELSGGMKKRVDLARAYASDPEVILMDEPFGALDILTKEKLQIELQEMWMKEPKTILFITHDLEEALFLGDRVVIMTPRPGKIHRILDVAFERPRQKLLKTSKEFVDRRREIIESLEEYS
jgi:NitT/TauT family transport system ATP-binding protein